MQFFCVFLWGYLFIYLFIYLVFLVTSATEGEGGYVFTPFLSFFSVCLLVCLCTEYLKKLWMNSDEIWWAGSVCNKDKLIRF